MVFATGQSHVSVSRITPWCYIGPAVLLSARINNRLPFQRFQAEAIPSLFFFQEFNKLFAVSQYVYFVLFDKIPKKFADFLLTLPAGLNLGYSLILLMLATGGQLLKGRFVLHFSEALFRKREFQPEWPLDRNFVEPEIVIHEDLTY